MAGLNVNMLTNMLAYHSLCVLLISVIIRVICGALVLNYVAINLTYPVAVFVKFQHGYCIDTVRRSAVLQKLAQLDIPDHFVIGFRTIYRTTLTVLYTTNIHRICELSLPV